MSRRGRSLSVLLLVLVGGLGIISSTQTWLVLDVTTTAEPVAIPGADALPVLAPMSLTVLALAGVLAIVGTVLRYVFAVLAGMIGVWLTAATLPLLKDPPPAAFAGTVTELTGLSGTDAILSLVDGVAPTAWPAVGLGLWGLLILTAAFIAATARHWRSGGRRFRTRAAAAGGPVDAIDSWDELSRGTDPTGGDR